MAPAKKLKTEADDTETEQKPKVEVADSEAASPDETNGADSPEARSELDNKIRRQVEYYFGDLNISRDRFMQEEMKKDDGWIELSVMMKFNRLAQMTKDESVVATALANSSNDLVQVNEDKTKIRRNPDRKLPEMNQNWKDDVANRSLYVKGFPLTATLDDLIPFLDSVQPSENILMRKLREGSFKGSVFVTYKTLEAAKKVKTELETRKFKEDDAQPVIVKFQRIYYDEKKSERSSRKGKWKEENNKDSQKDVNGDNKQEGAVLKVKGLDSEEITREHIKEVFAAKTSSEVAWITYSKGDSEAFVRFHGEGDAVKAIEACGGTVTFPPMKDTKLELELLEGEEEDSYWKRYFEERRSKQSNFKRGGGRGGRAGRGGRGGGRGGRGGGGGKRGGATDVAGDEPEVKREKKD